MMLLKKNDRLIDVENQTEWTFDCKTRGPDALQAGARPAATWTYVLHNKEGHRRFVSEAKLAEAFKRKELVH